MQTPEPRYEPEGAHALFSGRLCVALRLLLLHRSTCSHVKNKMQAEFKQHGLGFRVYLDPIKPPFLGILIIMISVYKSLKQAGLFAVKVGFRIKGSRCKQRAGSTSRSMHYTDHQKTTTKYQDLQAQSSKKKHNTSGPVFFVPKALKLQNPVPWSQKKI